MVESEQRACLLAIRQQQSMMAFRVLALLACAALADVEFMTFSDFRKDNRLPQVSQ